MHVLLGDYPAPFPWCPLWFGSPGCPEALVGGKSASCSRDSSSFPQVKESNPGSSLPVVNEGLQHSVLTGSLHIDFMQVILALQLSLTSTLLPLPPAIGDLPLDLTQVLCATSSLSLGRGKTSPAILGLSRQGASVGVRLQYPGQTETWRGGEGRGSASLW